MERFITKKSLGQHFLNSSAVPRWMCDAADLTEKEVVLEVGPGTGALTKELLARGAHVIALETDTRALKVLESTFAASIANGDLALIHTDVRTLDLTSMPELTDHHYKVVANIPYYLSGFLFRTFLESGVQPSTLVFLVQKEVAKRITSSISTGEKESLLSLSVKAFGEPSYVKTVSRNHFSPAPKVDSAIVAVRNISRENFTDVDQALFFKTLHLGFGQKRKQLLGNLSKQYSRALLTNIFSTLSLPVSVRAEDVPLEMWLTLVRTLQTHT